MKVLTKLAGVAAVGAAILSSAGANAAEVSANVTMATDYVFRGVSQTSEKGTIQGGFDVGFDNGAYVGTWASNVDFGSEVTTEMDFYVGYGMEIADGIELDVSYIYFLYAGQEAALNYSEFTAGVSIGDLGLGVVFSPDYFGSSESAYVLNADYSLPLGDAATVDMHVGYTSTEMGVLGSFDDYVDWSLGVNGEVSGLGVGLTYYGTNADDATEFGEIAEGRVVFSVSKSM